MLIHIVLLKTKENQWKEWYTWIGVFEILDLDDDIKELVMNGASSIEIRKQALKGKYKPLVVDGIRKVVEGITNLEELNRKLLIF